MKTQTKCVPIFFVVTIHKSFWKTKLKFDNRNLDIDWIGKRILWYTTCDIPEESVIHFRTHDSTLKSLFTKVW